MAQTFEFFDERARESAAEAQGATLASVRARALRSEAAWREMAERALQTQETRDAVKRSQEERIAAEAPEHKDALLD